MNHAHKCVGYYAARHSPHVFFNMLSIKGLAPPLRKTESRFMREPAARAWNSDDQNSPIRPPRPTKFDVPGATLMAPVIAIGLFTSRRCAKLKPMPV